MAGLENLFAVEPQLPNVYKTKLPESPEKWAEIMTTNVREQFPDIAKLPLSVEFKKKDDQAGTAIGAIHVVSVEAGKSLYIPFVIEKFHLHPLDVWMEKKTQAVHPLTQDTFKEFFFVRNIADGLDARPADSTGNYFNDPSMWTQTYPPLQGRYSYASAGYQILDQIADTMTESDLNAFKEELKASPMLIQKFEKHGHAEIIQKLAAKKSTAKTKDFGSSATKMIPISAVSVKKNGLDDYSILTSADKMFDLHTTHHSMNKDMAKKFLSNLIGKPQDFLNEVDENGEKFAIIRPVMSGVWLYDADEKGAVSADEFGCYTMKNKTGLTFNAVVIPDVVNYEGKRVKGKVVLSPTHSSFQDSVAGIEQKDSKAFESILKPSNVRTGQMGTFIFIGENGKAIATPPVTIKALEDSHIYHVVDLNGKKFRIRQGWGKEFKYDSGKNTLRLDSESKPVTLESLGFAEASKDCYIIPETMMWIPMSPMTDVVHSPKEWMEKTAASKMSMNPVEMRYTGIVYEFRGGDMPKIAYNERETNHMLANLGLDQEKIAKAKHKAKHAGKCTIHGAEKLKHKEETETKAEEAAEKVAMACKNLRRVLIKEAAEIEDKATVDVVLSLGFLNPENLAKFVSYIPVLEQAADHLAETTLASRLGLKQISEAASTGAMSKILEVVDGLKKVRSSMKKPSTKVG